MLRQERYAGMMQRSFYVGEHITEEDVKASYESGVLAIQLAIHIAPATEKVAIKIIKNIHQIFTKHSGKITAHIETSIHLALHCWFLGQSCRVLPREPLRVLITLWSLATPFFPFLNDTYIIVKDQRKSIAKIKFFQKNFYQYRFRRKYRMHPPQTTTHSAITAG